MQTFLPYPVFSESARCLDRQRLGKQRVECYQLLKALLVPGSGWSNHPAAKMWRGYEIALGMYGMIVCNEWTERGYKDTCHGKIRCMLPTDVFAKRFEYPTWLGDFAFHESHRSNLLRKDPIHYGQFGWTESNDLSYVWPNP